MTETIPVYAEHGHHAETCRCDTCMLDEAERLAEEVELLKQTIRARDASIRQLRAQLRNALKA